MMPAPFVDPAIGDNLRLVGKKLDLICTSTLSSQIELICYAMYFKGQSFTSYC